ncbi:winged helix-turn-helix domain-containing protein [Rickettsiales bacterium]|nr:winged helix-turn-helix domain-containing protein [Rickettsiales bacterium]
MPRTSSTINEDLVLKCKIALKQQGKSREISRRLQAIISAKDHNISKVSSIFGITRATLLKWIKDFDKKSVDGLVVSKGRGRRKIFDSKSENRIRKIIEKNPSITAISLKKVIEDKMAITVGIATIYRLIKRLGFSYITPRKYHYKQDKVEVGRFKKNLKGK